MEHEPNLAVIESRVVNIEGYVHDLVKLQQAQGTINGNLEKTIALLQQSHVEFINRYTAEDKPKVAELWENRSEFKGGWVFASVIGGILVGGSVVGGLAYTLLQHIHQ